MMNLVRLDIPEGAERDAFIRRIAAAKSSAEAQAIVEKVQEFHEPVTSSPEQEEETK